MPTRERERIENYYEVSNQRPGEEKEAVLFMWLFPSIQLVRTFWHIDGLLDFTDNKDTGQHLLQLLFWDRLSGVPDGAVWSHDGLRSQVEGVVTSFGALGTEDKHIGTITQGVCSWLLGL